MNTVYTTNGQDFDEFAAAREQFTFLTEGMRDQVKGMEHAEIEALLFEGGNELLRRVLQGHLNRLASEEPVHPGIIGNDGIERTNRRRHCQKDLMTLFGEVEVSRIRYSIEGQSSLHPLDARLNLPEDKYSHSIRRRIAEEAAKASFDASIKAVERTTGGKVPKLQAEQLTVRAAQDFESFYRLRKCQVEKNKDDFLVITLDEKGVVMRKDSLRGSTRKAAEREKHKMKTRLSRGEKGNRKRMATVASVYSTAEYHRTPEEIMNVDDGPAEARPRPTNKRVWASLVREPLEITKAAFEEALRRDPEKRLRWVALVDGNERQLKNIWAQIIEHGLEGIVTPILDFIHVLEYLWAAVTCFYQEGTPDAEAWVQRKALLILHGKSSVVAASIRRSATQLELAEDDRKAADTCARYLLNHRDMLRYDKYLSQGMPIATGVIEGACRHLIKDRLDITGARWGLEGAEAVLRLRSLQSSGDFDAYWDFHKKQEHERCHLSRYQSPDLALAA